ncbi:hypothetical protein RCC89_00430 [Cytophagaceae bacterium ABcell3]|nr:hypothetical protein RCC89_00430 [Cytophagaceae bacterium ABcell3]
MKNVFYVGVVVLFLLSGLNTGFAQEEPFRKHEIGLDVSGLFGAGTGKLFYRNHTENNAFRVSLSLGGRFMTNTDEGLSGNASQSFSSSLALGYQWNRPFDKWAFYYGSDAVLGYQSNSYVTPSESREVNYRGYGLSGGLQPFVGLSYSFSEAVSLSVETALNISWIYNESKTRVHEFSSGINRPLPTFTERGLSFFYRPVSLLMISYHF